MAARWELRCENFESALAVLADAAREYREREFSVLEKAGVIQHFEIAWELGWKVMRDFLAENGAEVMSTPGSVIRGAFAAGLIADGDGWMDALRLRNRLSHEYNREHADRAVEAIFNQHLARFSALAETLRHERDAHD